MAKDTIDDNNEVRKKGQSVITDPQRRKVLMKRLEKIKLNRSHGSISFCDMGTFYEKKLRMLKNNNASLAKALAEQRQVSQTWYDEVVSLKEELYETQTNLLRFRMDKNVDYDIAIQNAAEMRIKEITDPLDSAAQDCLNHVLGVADGIKTIRCLVASLLKINNDKKMNCSSSTGSSVVRPLLTRTLKPPRKNVVHPMVEGHVLQPATIHLPRVTLDESLKYQLQEQAELQERRMDVIGEVSTSLREEFEVSPCESESDAMPQEVREISETRTLPPILDDASPMPETLYETVTAPEKSLLQLDSSCLRLDKRGEPKTSVDHEDPLEGSSWMHLKRKKRVSKRSKSRSSAANRKRSSSLRLFVESSSDSDEEMGQVEVKDSSKMAAIEKELVDRTIMPTDSKVCRRSQRRQKNFQIRTYDCDIQDEPRSSVPLESFFINGSLANDPKLPVLEDCYSSSVVSPELLSSLDTAGVEDLSPITVTTAPLSFLPSPSLVTSSIGNTTSCTTVAADAASSVANIFPNKIVQPTNEDIIRNNHTLILESSMEMTECLNKDFLAQIAEANKNFQPVTSAGLKEDNLLNPVNKPTRSRRFFKNSDIDEISAVVVGASKPKEKVIVDSKVCHRSQRRQKTRQIRTYDCDIQDEPRPSVPLESFFINGSLANDPKLPVLEDCYSSSVVSPELLSSLDTAAAEDLSPITVTTAPLSFLPSPSLVTSSIGNTTSCTTVAADAASSVANIFSNKIVQPTNEDIRNNHTLILESSMEMTVCLDKDFLAQIADANKNFQPVTSAGLKEDNLSNPVNKPTRSRRFFKNSDIDEISAVVVAAASKPKEKTPFDLSQIETSIMESDTIIKGKENVPPKSDCQEDFSLRDKSVNLKDVSIVVEDIMKTPSIVAELSLPSHTSSKEKISEKEVSVLPPRKSASRKKTRKERKNKDHSPSRKVKKTKRKKINFCPHASPVSDATSSGDTWSPHNGKKGKRKATSKQKPKKDEKLADLFEANLFEESKSIEQCFSNSFDGFESHSVVEGEKIEVDQEKGLNEEGSSVSIPPVGESVELKEAISKVDENIDNDPFFNELLIEMSLLKNSFDNEEVFDPATLVSVMEEESSQPPPEVKMDKDNENPQIALTVDSVEDHASASAISPEGVKTRPRRATASKVTSYKEPGLHKKMRRSGGKTKNQRSSQKSPKTTTGEHSKKKTK